MLTDTLNKIMDCPGGATINNLYSPDAKLAEGSIIKSRNDIAKCLKAKLPLVKALNEPDDMKPYQGVFYSVTHAGAKKCGRLDEYKTVGLKVNPDIEHESGVADLMLACKRFWPDKPVFHKWEIRNGKGKIETDFMQDNIFFEFERKTYPSQTIISKIKKYERFNLPKGSKVAFVWCHVKYDVFMRSQTIKELKSTPDWTLHEENDKVLSDIQKSKLPVDKKTEKELKRSRWLIAKNKRYKESLRQFEILIDSVKKMNLCHDYRFIHASDSYILDQKVARDNSGKGCFIK